MHDHRTGVGRLVGVTIAAAVVAASLINISASPASATSQFTLATQGQCTAWGNVILAGSAYAPGVPGAPNVYSNLYKAPTWPAAKCDTAYSNGSSAYGLRYQCTEFAVRWAAAVWHVDPSQWKSGGRFVDAYQMWGQASHIAGLTLIRNGSGAPQPGDLMVFQDTSVGHVAVVAGVSGGNLYFVGQNQSTAEQRFAMANSTTVSDKTASTWLGLPGHVVGWIRGPNPVQPLHTAIGLIPNDGASGYTVDGYGKVRAFGNAPAVTSGLPGWSGWDIARGIAVNPGSTPEAATGYVLDGWGGIHPFAAGGAAPPPVPTDEAYWKGWDIARAIVLSKPDAGYVLDGWGGIHPFAAPGATAPLTPTIQSYWKNWDIARAMVLSTPTSGYVLDGYGGIHPFGPNAATTPATPTATAYWSGWDIARGLALLTPKSGFVLDGYGGMHPFAAAGTPLPTPQAPGYDSGHDVFRGIAADPGSGQVADVRAFNSDGSGGNVYRFTA